MIAVKRLIKRAGDKIILKGVDLSISAGETVAILGSNGAGKSTLLKIMALLTKPTEGEIRIDSLSTKEIEQQLKQRIGYLPHNSMLYDHFTPLENLLFYGRLYGVTNLEDKAKELIDEVGMSFFRNEPVKSFSRGMIQRIAIARAIIHSPKILLLDEPHTGLDQEAVSLLNHVIRRMKGQQTTAVMVTHDFKQAAEICDRIVILKNGKVADDFPLKEQNTEWVTSKYLKQVANES